TGYLDRASAEGAGLAPAIRDLRDVVAGKALEAAGRDVERERWAPARSLYPLASTLAPLRHAPPAEQAQLQATLGYLDFKLEDYGDARDRFAAARVLQPGDGETRYMLARAELESGDAEAGG